MYLLFHTTSWREQVQQQHLASSAANETKIVEICGK